MSRIYLAYRKSDAHPEVQKVIDSLTKAQGAASLMHGTAVAVRGADYRTMVESAMRDCAGTVIIAGPEFDSAPDALGRKRLDNPDDPLRIEMEAALKVHKMMLIVALVGGYEMPEAAQLPRSLRPLTRRGVLQLNPSEGEVAYFTYLNNAVRRMRDGSAKRLIRNMIIVFALVTVASLLWMVYSTVQLNVPR